MQLVKRWAEAVLWRQKEQRHIYRSLQSDAVLSEMTQQSSRPVSLRTILILSFHAIMLLSSLPYLLLYLFIYYGFYFVGLYAFLLFI